MSESETLAGALVAALSELTNATKGHKANAGKKVYTFTNIGDLVAETRPVLAKHGLVALTSVHGFEGRLACTIELVHTSGETKRFDPLPFPEGNDAQTTGSWMTYMRRYALLSALGMGTEDDDGKAAQAPQQRREPVPQSISAGNAKTSLLERLGDMDGARDVATRIWSEQIGDSRAITSAEWDALCEAADLAVDHYRNEPLVEAEMLEAGDR